MIFPRLKRGGSLYCLSGTALAAVLFLTILSVRYTDHLERQSDKVQEIILKTRVMEKTNKDMEELVGRLALTDAGNSMAPREAILVSLDDIKKRLSASGMSLAAFDERDGAVSLGVEIEAPLGEYAVFVRNVHYLESMSEPWFTMEKAEINNDGDGYKVKLRGVAMMPSEQAERNK
ncbi:MAG: hypothetical protein ACE5DR_05935 [Thermodesulfobacteriota bacterium]